MKREFKYIYDREGMQKMRKSGILENKEESHISNRKERIHFKIYKPERKFDCHGFID